VSGQRLAKRRHDPVAGVGDHGRRRDPLARELRDLVERALPFRAERDGVGHAGRSSTTSIQRPRLGQVQPIRHRQPFRLSGMGSPHQSQMEL
jgi:hypothetical protein